MNKSNIRGGNSLAVQWLGLHALTAEGPDSIPGWGTKIPQAAESSQKNPKKTKTLNQKIATTETTQEIKFDKIHS